MLLSVLKDKLTYSMAVVAVAFGLYGLVSGVVDATVATEWLWLGLTAFGVRRALPK